MEMTAEALLKINLLPSALSTAGLLELFSFLFAKLKSVHLHR